MQYGTSPLSEFSFIDYIASPCCLDKDLIAALPFPLFCGYSGNEVMCWSPHSLDEHLGSELRLGLLLQDALRRVVEVVVVLMSHVNEVGPIGVDVNDDEEVSPNRAEVQYNFLKWSWVLDNSLF
jgi:hypothetical protein